MSDHAALVERLRTLARDISTVSSVAQRPAEHDKQMIRRLDEWSSTAYHIADAGRETLAAALRLAAEATNGWACYAKRDIEHRDIARLHQAIAALRGGQP